MDNPVWHGRCFSLFAHINEKEVTCTCTYSLEVISFSLRMPWSTINSPGIVGFWLLDAAWVGVTSLCLVLGFQSFSSHQLTSLKHERWCTTSSSSSFLERNGAIDKPKPRNGVSVKWWRQNQIDLMGIVGGKLTITGSPLLGIPRITLDRNSQCFGLSLLSRTLRSRKIRISAAQKRSCRRRRTRTDLAGWRWTYVIPGRLKGPGVASCCR